MPSGHPSLDPNWEAYTQEEKRERLRAFWSQDGIEPSLDALERGEPETPAKSTFPDFPWELSKADKAKWPDKYGPLDRARDMVMRRVGANIASAGRGALGLPEEVGRWLDGSTHPPTRLLEKAREPTGLEERSGLEWAERQEQLRSEGRTTRAVLEGLGGAGVDIVTNLAMLYSVGAVLPGAAAAGKATRFGKAVGVAKNAGRIAGFRAITTPGTLEERFETGVITMLYALSPILSGQITHHVGTAIIADVLTNTGISIPVTYIDAIREADSPADFLTNPEVLGAAVGDIVFALGTRPWGGKGGVRQALRESPNFQKLKPAEQRATERALQRTHKNMATHKGRFARRAPGQRGEAPLPMNKGDVERIVKGLTKAANVGKERAQGYGRTIRNLLTKAMQRDPAKSREIAKGLRAGKGSISEKQLRFMAEGEKTPKQLKMAHALRTEKGMGEGAYRAIISRLTNGRTNSMADMTRPEASRLIDELQGGPMRPVAESGVSTERYPALESQKLFAPVEPPREPVALTRYDEPYENPDLDAWRQGLREYERKRLEKRARKVVKRLIKEGWEKPEAEALRAGLMAGKLDARMMREVLKPGFWQGLYGETVPVRLLASWAEQMSGIGYHRAVGDHLRAGADGARDEAGWKGPFLKEWRRIPHYQDRRIGSFCNWVTANRPQLEALAKLNKTTIDAVAEKVLSGERRYKALSDSAGVPNLYADKRAMAWSKSYDAFYKASAPEYQFTRFRNFFQYDDKDIRPKGVPDGEMYRARQAYKEGGEDALRAFLADKDYGLIKSHYSPIHSSAHPRYDATEDWLRPAVERAGERPGAETAGGFSEGHFMARKGTSTVDLDKSMFQIARRYAKQLAAQKHMRGTYLELARLLNARDDAGALIIPPKLRDILITGAKGVAGYRPPQAATMRAVDKFFGQFMRVSMMQWWKGMRNAAQVLMHWGRSLISTYDIPGTHSLLRITPLRAARETKLMAKAAWQYWKAKETLNPSDLEYFETYVRSDEPIRDVLFATPGTPIHPAIDTVNAFAQEWGKGYMLADRNSRALIYFSTLEKGREGIRAWQAGKLSFNDLANEIGLDMVANISTRGAHETLKLMSEGRYDEALRQIGEYNATHTSQWGYAFGERSHVEQRYPAATRFMVFSRGLALNTYKACTTLWGTEKATPTANRAAMQWLFGTFVVWASMEKVKQKVFGEQSGKYEDFGKAAMEWEPGATFNIMEKYFKALVTKPWRIPRYAAEELVPGVRLLMRNLEPLINDEVYEMWPGLHKFLYGAEEPREYTPGEAAFQALSGRKQGRKKKKKKAWRW